ncbi:MAG: hypothetical protein ABI402_02600 [Ferruginibacter sp.]
MDFLLAIFLLTTIVVIGVFWNDIKHFITGHKKNNSHKDNQHS